MVHWGLDVFEKKGGLQVTRQVLRCGLEGVAHAPHVDDGADLLSGRGVQHHQHRGEAEPARLERGSRAARADGHVVHVQIPDSVAREHVLVDEYVPLRRAVRRVLHYGGVELPQRARPLAEL